MSRRNKINYEEDLDPIDFNNYKGFFYDEELGPKMQDEVTGAHFKYCDMVVRLKKLQKQLRLTKAIVAAQEKQRLQPRAQKQVCLIPLAQRKEGLSRAQSIIKQRAETLAEACNKKKHQCANSIDHMPLLRNSKVVPRKTYLIKYHRNNSIDRIEDIQPEWLNNIQPLNKRMQNELSSMYFIFTSINRYKSYENISERKRRSIILKQVYERKTSIDERKKHIHELIKRHNIISKAQNYHNKLRIHAKNYSEMVNPIDKENERLKILNNQRNIRAIIGNKRRQSLEKRVLGNDSEFLLGEMRRSKNVIVLKSNIRDLVKNEVLNAKNQLRNRFARGSALSFLQVMMNANK